MRRKLLYLLLIFTSFNAMFGLADKYKTKAFPGKVSLKNLSGEKVFCFWKLGTYTADWHVKDKEMYLDNGAAQAHGGSNDKVYKIEIKNIKTTTDALGKTSTSPNILLATISPSIETYDLIEGKEAYYLFKKKIDATYVAELVTQETYNATTVETETTRLQEEKAAQERAATTQAEATTALNTGGTTYVFYPSAGSNGAYYDEKWSLATPDKGVLYFNAKAIGDKGFLVQFSATAPDATKKFISSAQGGQYYNLIINGEGATLESYFAKKKEDSAEMDMSRKTVVGTTSELKTTPDVSEDWRIIVNGPEITVKKAVTAETESNSINIPEGHSFTVPEGFVIENIKYFAFGGLGNKVEYASINSEDITEDVNVKRLVFKEYFKTPTPGSATIKFEFCGKSDVHIALSPEAKDMPGKQYFLILGAKNNTVTQLVDGRNAATQKSLGEEVIDKIKGGLKDGDGKGTTWNPMWITVSGNNNVISYGRGDDPTKNLVKKWTVTNPLEDLVEYIGFGGKGLAQFRNISIVTGPALSGKEAVLSQVVVEIPFSLPKEFRGEVSGPIAKKLAVGLDKKGNPIAFIVDEKGKVHYWDVSSFDLSPWVEIPSKDKEKFTDIACSQDGVILALRDTGTLAKYNEEKTVWEDVKAPVLKNIKSIAISDTPISITKKLSGASKATIFKATIFVIAGEGEERLMYFLGDDKSWVPLSKKSALSLSIGKNGLLVAVNNDEQIKKYNQKLGKWEELSDPKKTHFLLVAAGDEKHIIAMATDYTIWKWDGKSFVPMKASGPVEFGINAAGWIGALTTDGKFFCNEAKSVSDIKKETRTQAQDKGKVKTAKAPKTTKKVVKKPVKKTAVKRVKKKKTPIKKTSVKRIKRTK
jgi:WD40 repeat protein